MMYGPAEARYPFKLSHVFSKLGTVTSLGLAGTIMASLSSSQAAEKELMIQVSSEWWAWEACALAASMLGPVSLAAQSCLLSTTSTFFQVPASLGIASAVRTGNLLGAGRGWEAKWASRTSLIMSIFFSACNRYVQVSTIDDVTVAYYYSVSFVSRSRRTGDTCSTMIPRSWRSSLPSCPTSLSSRSVPFHLHRPKPS